MSTMWFILVPYGYIWGTARCYFEIVEQDCAFYSLSNIWSMHCVLSCSLNIIFFSFSFQIAVCEHILFWGKALYKNGSYGGSIIVLDGIFIDISRQMDMLCSILKFHILQVCNKAFHSHWLFRLRIFTYIFT